MTRPTSWTRGQILAAERRVCARVGPDSCSATPNSTRCGARCGRRSSFPLAAAVSFAVGGGSQTPLFTIFGSVALLVLADFPGNRQARAAGLRGPGHQRRGPHHAGHAGGAAPVAGVALMFVLGVAVTFAGCAQRDDRGRPARHAADVRAARVHAARPDRRAAAGLADRAGGVRARRAVPASAAPSRRAAPARGSACAQRWPTASRAPRRHEDVDQAMHALRDNFLGADFRPVGLTAGSRALVRVVDDLEWLSDRVTDDTGRAARGHAGTRGAGAAGLGRGAAHSAASPSARPTRADLERRADRPAVGRARAATARTSPRSSASPTTRRRSTVGRKLLNRRTIAATVGGDRPGDPQRGGRRRPPGVGAGAGPSAARRPAPPTG